MESLAFLLLVKHNSFQNAAVTSAANYWVGTFYESFAGVLDYLRLDEINEALRNENAMLRGKQPNSFFRNQADTLVAKDSLGVIQYAYIPAKVINNSVVYRNNYLTLNRGSKDGVKKHMGVICPEGIVGIVMNVSDHFCTVQSALNKNSIINARVSENNYFGPLIWEGEDPRFGILKDINKHVEVKKGQTIVTSSYSHIFPENIPIGTIDEVGYDQGGNFYRLKVKLVTPFERLSSAYIIIHKMQDELLNLESDNPDNDQKP